jgi:hypothetical protein
MSTNVELEVDLILTEKLPVRIVEDRIEDGYGMIRTADSPPVQLAVLHDGTESAVATAEKLASLCGYTLIMRRLLTEATAAWAEQFDSNTEVPAANIVEWFASWRVVARAALSELREGA